MAANIPPLSFEASYQQGKLTDFFALEPNDTNAALKLDRPIKRNALVDALKLFASKHQAPKEVFAQLELLAKENTRAVVTGQQTGLLLGPTYSLSKAVTAMNLAKELTTEDKAVVPIFWLASQDHDTEEIDHAYLLDFKEQLHYLNVDLPKDTPAARISMKQEWLESVTASIQEADFQPVFKQEVLDLLTSTAANADSYTDWFAAIMFQLLGKHGLIIIDPMQLEIAALFKPIFKQELEHPSASVDAVNDAAKRLKSMGFEPQLGRGENATNLFLETKTADGFKRELLRFDGKTFFTENETYTKEELFEKLELDPRCLTPAAGFRPITQDFILPTVVLVGGPGELKYIAQLKGVYEHHKVAMPIIWSRATMTVFEPPVSRMMDKFGLSLEDLKSFEQKKQDILLNLHGHADSFNTTLSTLDEAIQKLITEVRSIDPSLEGSIVKGESYLSKTIDILKTKTAKALTNQDTSYTQQFERLEKQLFPNGTPQERIISPFSLFLKFGIDPVIKAFLKMPPQGDHEIRI